MLENDINRFENNQKFSKRNKSSMISREKKFTRKKNKLMNKPKQRTTIDNTNKAYSQPPRTKKRRIKLDDYKKYL